ncbi:serine/threonine protein kinase [Penicillium angulare]|uniref:Serine/threonine protein kinase n=1 Tax=Penicillium angulare TaxID=116970 RepID=A0A9W9G834_9EURO|nr:serine/threonine protein kinase [Penicillium angulare]
MEISKLLCGPVTPTTSPKVANRSLLLDGGDLFSKYLDPQGFRIPKSTIIGHGNTGVVLQTGRNVVKLPLWRVGDTKDKSGLDYNFSFNLAALRHEKEVYERLGKSQWIVPYQDGGEATLVLEFMSNGSLSGYFAKNREAITPVQMLHWFLQLATAVSFVHNSGVLLNDIHDGNVLLDCNLTVKLCDFGAARIIASDEGLSQKHKDEVHLDIIDVTRIIYQMTTGEEGRMMSKDFGLEERWLGWIMQRSMTGICSGGYSDARDLIKDLEAEMARFDIKA